MRSLMVVLLTLLMLAMTGQARAEAGKVEGKEITFTSGTEDVKGYLVMPEGKGPFPAIVVIQEWWGLNDWMKEKARRLAAEGYVCLVPDLYRGKVATEMKQASQLMKGLPHDRALRDLKAAVDTLAGRKDVHKDRIGAIGWCMGGGYALQLALADNRVKACVICYGRVITDPDKLASVEAGVLGIFGKEDKGIKIDDVRKFAAALKKAGKTATIHEYEAGHGFMREKSGEKENPEHRPGPTKEAWTVIDRFFARTLQGK